MAILRAVATVDLPAVPRFVADEVFKPYDRKAPPYARSRVTFFFPMRNVMNREIYPNAPIFDVAHYGTTCDLFDLAPALVEKLEG